MKYPSKPIFAKFISRSNRFLGIVEMNGKYIECFIPNPGRMNELMVPGAKVYLIHKPGDYRRTKYDLTLIEYNDILVSVDSRLPNQILREAIDQKRIEEFQCYKVQQNEPNFHDSRFDFKLTKGTKQILLEAKSCTLVEDGIALFPDAPTTRDIRLRRPV